jgi:hypothetical protein
VGVAAAQQQRAGANLADGFARKRKGLRLGARSLAPSELGLDRLLTTATAARQVVSEEELPRGAGQERRHPHERAFPWKIAAPPAAGCVYLWRDRDSSHPLLDSPEWRF